MLFRSWSLSRMPRLFASILNLSNDTVCFFYSSRPIRLLLRCIFRFFCFERELISDWLSFIRSLMAWEMFWDTKLPLNGVGMPIGLWLSILRELGSVADFYSRFRLRKL